MNPPHAPGHPKPLPPAAWPLRIAAHLVLVRAGLIMQLLPDDIEGLDRYPRIQTLVDQLHFFAFLARSRSKHLQCPIWPLFSATQASASSSCSKRASAATCTLTVPQTAFSYCSHQLAVGCQGMDSLPARWPQVCGIL